MLVPGRRLGQKRGRLHRKGTEKCSKIERSLEKCMIDKRQDG
jgi:hypothetical protein